MADNLPPGVFGPIKHPEVIEREKQLDHQVNTYSAVNLKSYFNPLPLLTRFYVLTIDAPATKLKAFIDKLQIRNDRRYYHQKFRRVPGIWECAQDDVVCMYEAESQFRRDKKVDTAILEVLEGRKNMCQNRFFATWQVDCKEYIDTYNTNHYNWLVKYGDLGIKQRAKYTLAKQKNRYVEKRYKERMGIKDESDYV